MAASIGPVTAGHRVFDVVGRSTYVGPIWLWAQNDLDLATVPAARTELAGLLSGATEPPVVLVYLGAERFVDVRGLRLLVTVARQARCRGGDLAVVAPPHCLRWMVDRFGLGDELFLAPDARSAARWGRTAGRHL